MATSTGRDPHTPSAKLLRSERYSFHVGAKTYTIQFLPMSHLDDYDEQQLAILAGTTAYEISYRLEDHTLPDGSIIAGYGNMGTGDAFRVLGAVANGTLDWIKARQPAFLYWYAHGTRAQRLYDRMIRYFAARGSGMHRCTADPFTGRVCQPETFWLRRSSSPAPAL